MSALDFHPSKPLTLGVELEWQIIDPATGKLKSKSVDLLDAINNADGKLTEFYKPEFIRSMIELNSGIHENANDLLAELYELQQAIDPILKSLNLALAGGGTHPFESWTNRKIYPNQRYVKLHQTYGFLLKRVSVYGQHIHIGCDTPENMLYLNHALGRYVPHFIALSAASPYYLGIDTYFDCARLSMMSAFPTSGTIPFITEWQAFQDYFQQLCKFRLVNSMKDLYWDIRPKPEYGTVELRICDSPLTLKKAAALGAYAQALSAYLLDKQPAIDHSIYIPYQYNRFAAMRYGLDAYILDIQTDTEKLLSEDILSSLAILKPYAKKLGSETLLATLEETCRTKECDAHKLREVYMQKHNLQATVEYAIQAWYSR